MIENYQSIESRVTISSDKSDLSTFGYSSFTKSIYSSAVLLEHNVLNVRYIVSAIEKLLDLESNSCILYSKDISSSVSYIEPSHRDISSFGYIPFIKDLISSSSVSYQNILDIIYRLAQAPILEMTQSVIHDTFLRQSRPTINYGYAESMMTGSMIDGVYRSMMRIGLSSYLNLTDEILVTAELILDVSGSYNSNLWIDAYEVTGNWEENLITWDSFQKNPLPISETPAFSFQVNSSLIKIDITNYIQQLKLRNLSEMNIIFKLRDESINTIFYFYSKDCGISSSIPYVRIKYQDKNWIGFSDIIDLNSEVSIRSSGNKDILSRVIPRVIGKDDLSSGVLVGRWEWQDLNGYSNIKGKIELDSYSVLTYFSDLESYISVKGRDNLNSEGIIVYSTDIESTSNIKPTYNLSSTAIILRSADVPSNSIITYSSDISSDATLRPSMNINSSIKITYHLDVDSSVLITKFYNLASSSKIPRAYKDLLSYALTGIVTDLDMDGNIIVKSATNNSGYADIVYSNDLSTTSVILPTSNLTGNIITVYSGNMDGSAQITAPHDIDSSSNLTKFTDILVNAIITGHRDMTGTALLGTWNVHDINGNINVQGALNSDGSAVIVYSSNIDSNVIVTKLTDINSSAISTLLSDMTGESNIISTNSLDSSVVVQRHDVSDLVQDAIARVSEIYEIDSYTFSIGLFVNDLKNCSALVRQIGRNYMNCNATITTKARTWIPNIHGVDKFNYQNRKLPRRWIRENFIP